MLAVLSQVALVLLLSIRLPMHLTIPIKRQAVPRSAEERLTFAISSSHILPTQAESTIDRHNKRGTSAPLLWQIANWGWALGTVICLFRLGFGLRRLHQLSRESKALNAEPWLELVQRLAKRLHIERPVRLTARSAATVPSTWGVVYPVIELPETADKWSKDQREFILLHELIHIVRWDALMDIAVGIITSIFWFDPLVWLAAGRYRSEREIACDEAVLSFGGLPSRYAETLLAVEQSAGADFNLIPGSLAAVGSNELRRRIVAILTEKKASSPARGLWHISILTCIPCLCLTLASMRMPSVTAAKTLAMANSCTVQKNGLIDVTLSVPNAQTVSVAGAHDNGQTILTAFDGKSCPTAVFGGQVQVSDALDDVVDFSGPEDSFKFVDSVDSQGRAVFISKAHGVLAHRYTVSGAEHPWSEGRAWFAEQFGNLVRDYGYEANARVNLLLRTGGTEAVLEEGLRTRSALGKERLFDALLDQGHLKPNDVARVAQMVMSLEPSTKRDALLQRIRADQ